MHNNTKPLIGVISCTRSVEGEEAYIVKTRYADAVARYAHAVPVICPGLEATQDAEALVARLDAILLTGSNSNIEPARYGANSGRSPFDRRRDAMTDALVSAALKAGKPVFGICRGLQEINVALGGTLMDQRDSSMQDLLHHAPDGADLDAMFGHAHIATPVPGTPLAVLLGDEPLRINSVHYQTVGTLGAGLVVNATAEDGVVEAISSAPGAPSLLAVQWHPEWRPEGRAHDLLFWEEVGRIARLGHF
ncbi:gamma-glutamyl-gamma-aminobutyrate hydrolase family protein [Devosia sp. RR2S18]|uniref:gamma-glutamyl-gamma-aminobutyrate hydrolase family protein n=1 Tax=Devosia rhizosphaerae TaxID=3049774 RepID=UPI00253F9E25|nr:gamma-glutamyl-gamma-aminobutyrate hydrolase family protein [Devosia sp. RR2S18]WIJ25095.1 gamma-glutamyl-gamma-aminobutyrate hydrolase family protein [Devosia sp. RR2S18]